MPKRILYLGLDPTHYATAGMVTHWPIIQIVPRPLSDPLVEGALREFPLYTHVLVTSKSTVSILQNYLSALHMRELWVHKHTVAIGRITAGCLQAVGITASTISEQETGEGMVQTLQTLNLAGAYLFLPQSAQARPLLRNFLSTQQLPHRACALYDTLPQAPFPPPSLQDFDEVVFTSPSTVDAFLKGFGPPPPILKLTAIGPVTAQYLRDQGWA